MGKVGTLCRIRQNGLRQTVPYSFGRHFCRPWDRRHIVAQMAGDEMSLTHGQLRKLAIGRGKFIKLIGSILKSPQLSKEIGNLRSQYFGAKNGLPQGSVL